LYSKDQEKNWIKHEKLTVPTYSRLIAAITGHDDTSRRNYIRSHFGRSSEDVCWADLSALPVSNSSAIAFYNEHEKTIGLTRDEYEEKFLPGRAAEIKRCLDHRDDATIVLYGCSPLWACCFTGEWQHGIPFGKSKKLMSIIKNRNIYRIPHPSHGPGATDYDAFGSEYLRNFRKSEAR